MAPSGSTTQPYDLPEELVDEAGALSDPAAVRAAQDRLFDETGLQLFVVFVDSFDGLSGPAWADRTAELSGLGANDLLLAVAVDGAWADSLPHDAGISDQQADAVATEIERALRDRDFDAAAIAAADGYREAALDRGSIWTRGWMVVLYGISAVAVFFGFGALSSARRDRARRADEAQRRSELAAELGAAQVALDDALDSSESELGYAEAEFDRTLTEPFRAALEQSRQESVAVYRDQTALGDLEGTSDHGRAVTELNRLLDVVRGASQRLTDHATAFTELRSLKDRAPQRIEELRADLAAASRRLDDLGGGLNSRTDLSAGVKSQVAQLLESVSEQLDAAAQALEQAEQRVAADEPENAVVPLRTAEQALSQARAALDQTAEVDALVASWTAELEKAKASLAADVEDAARIATDLPEATALADKARQALAGIGSDPHADPVEAAEQLAEIERQLDAALATRRDEVERRARDTQRAEQQISRANSRLQNLQRQLSSRRASAPAHVRRGHVQAADMLGQAMAALATDPAAADGLARQADGVISRALNDIRSASTARSSAGWGGSTWGGSTWGGGSSSRSSSARRSSSRRRSSSGGSRRSSSRASGRSSGRSSRGGRF